MPQEIIREKARQFCPVLYPEKDMLHSAIAGSLEASESTATDMIHIRQAPTHIFLRNL